MALAVNTPDHLAGLGLMDKLNSTETDKEDISYLFHVALQKVRRLQQKSAFSQQ